MWNESTFAISRQSALNYFYSVVSSLFAGLHLISLKSCKIRQTNSNTSIWLKSSTAPEIWRSNYGWVHLSLLVCNIQSRKGFSGCAKFSWVARFPEINSRFRSHHIDRCPLDTRHHRIAPYFVGGRIFLVASQTLSTWVCWTDRWEWDKQWQPEVPAASRNSAAGTTFAGAAEATAATSTASQLSAEQYQ